MPHRVISTIGHSVRPIEAFLQILRMHEIALVCDVRRFPSSRRHPQFGQQALQRSLSEAGIGYAWIEALGGRRPTAALNPINDAWRVKAFHAYADYTQLPEFQEGLKRLEDLATQQAVAVMCAEALWTKCHRRLIADQLVARGWEVRHLIDGKRTETHVMPDFAVVGDGNVMYLKADGGQLTLPLG